MSEAGRREQQGLTEAQFWCLQRKKPWLTMNGTEACEEHHKEHLDIAPAVRTIHEHVKSVRPKGVEPELEEVLTNYTVSVLVHRGVLSPKGKMWSKEERQKAKWREAIASLADGKVEGTVRERLAAIQCRVLGLLRAYRKRDPSQFDSWVKSEDCWNELKRGGHLTDGVVRDDGGWKNAEPRILWLLREPHYQDERKDDLCTWLKEISEVGFVGKWKHFKKTWCPVARTTWALSREATPKDGLGPDHHESLAHIAVINLVKTGGKGASVPKYLSALAKRPEYWARVLREVDRIQPDLVIAGNILNWFPKESQVRLAAPRKTGKKSGGPFPSTSRNKVTWVNAFHPSIRGYDIQKYVNRIREALDA